jgi:hypothetical protein
MRKTLVFFAGAAILVAFVGTALADTGGTPNGNAFDGSNGQGRKTVCPPPGSAFKTMAQAPGPNNNPFNIGLTPGQVVVSFCELGPN